MLVDLERFWVRGATNPGENLCVSFEQNEGVNGFVARNCNDVSNQNVICIENI